MTRLDRHLSPGALRTALEHDVRAGLTATPKLLPPKWFYDARGSELFERITRLDEYYPTRRERSVLEQRAPEIAAATGADTLIELGSGTSEKTRLLLDALRAAGTLRRFVPFDVDETVLTTAAEKVAADYDIEVHAVVGDFEHHLPLLPTGGRRLVAFLGGTIGNLLPAERADFLAALVSTFAPGDALLLGTDLVKGADRLVAAYDDRSGVTAEFNRNVLRVVNRELGGDLDVEAFAHVARWNAAEERIEMWLRSTRAQTATLQELGLTVHFAEGEEVLTETSAKFTEARVASELAAAGLELRQFWTDEAGDFGVSLSTRG